MFMTIVQPHPRSRACRHIGPVDAGSRHAKTVFEMCIPAPLPPCRFSISKTTGRRVEETLVDYVSEFYGTSVRNDFSFLFEIPPWPRVICEGAAFQIYHEVFQRGMGLDVSKWWPCENNHPRLETWDWLIKIDRTAIQDFVTRVFLQVRIRSCGRADWAGWSQIVFG